MFKSPSSQYTHTKHFVHRYTHIHWHCDDDAQQAEQLSEREQRRTPTAPQMQCGN